MKRRSVYAIFIAICISFSCVLSVHGTSEPSNLSTSETNDTNYSVPPASISFNSVEQLAEFALCTDESDPMIQEYAASYCIDSERLLTAARAISNLPLPFVKNPTEGTSSGIRYYFDYSLLEIIHRVNDIQYRFTYSTDNSPPTPLTSPVELSNVQIDTITVDFHKSDSDLFACASIDGQYFYILIYRNRFKLIRYADHNVFRFQKPIDIASSQKPSVSETESEETLKQGEEAGKVGLFIAIGAVAVVVLVSAFSVILIKKKKLTAKTQEEEQ
ncbi:MAG: hypothetical protein IKC26_02980 [Clostridia bacterium]|nr:hypothetical protein [Clostridia bacterium]